MISGGNSASFPPISSFAETQQRYYHLCRDDGAIEAPNSIQIIRDRPATVNRLVLKHSESARRVVRETSRRSENQEIRRRFVEVRCARCYGMLP